MSRNDRPTIDPNVIAALHEVGGRWHAVVARRESRVDSSSEPALRLLGSQTFSGSSAPSSIQEWLARHNCGRVVGVLPATAVICRTSQLPNGSVERLLPALRLQAEGHLLGDIPEHRIAMAIMPASEGDSHRTGVIVAWPTASKLSEAATLLDRTLSSQEPGTPEFSWIPETGALAALVDGSRSREPVVWCDRASSGVALLLKHKNGVLMRATREENENADDWIAGVGRVVADSEMSIGATPEETANAVNTVQACVGSASEGIALVLPGEIEERLAAFVSETPSDTGWWQHNGIALGALVAAGGTLAPLASLRREPIRERPTPVAAIAMRLSEPRIAALLVLVAIALIVAWPVAAATLRLSVLRAKVPELREVQRDVEDLERMLAMYRALSQQSLPMHKLLADVANSTPDGIELETLTISRSDGVGLRGQAAPRDGRTAEDLILLMSTRMNESRVFDQSAPSWDVANTMGIANFRLSARVSRPYHPVSYPEEWDFGALTLAERRYGPAARTTAPPKEGDRATASRDSESSRTPSGDTPTEVVAADPPRAGSGRPSGGGRATARPATDSGETGEGTPPAGSDGEDAEATADDRPGAPGDSRRLAQRGTGEASGAATRGRRMGAQPDEVPPPLSSAQIRSMSRAEAQAALAEISRARLRTELDPEVSARLREEFDLLLEQTRRGG